MDPLLEIHTVVFGLDALENLCSSKTTVMADAEPRLITFYVLSHLLITIIKNYIIMVSFITSILGQKITGSGSAS